jgi:hypothetical protein
VAPLQLIGTFLSYAGNQMLNDIYQKYNKKIFYANHEAVKIVQINSSTFLTEVRYIGKSDSARPNLFFKTRNVVLATGAIQVTSPNIRSLFGLRDHSQVFQSDFVLKQDGF